ncbi:MAG TPA: acyloxyacyl hydrolase [Tepidisphaeraceae bacterium]
MRYTPLFVICATFFFAQNLRADDIAPRPQDLRLDVVPAAAKPFAQGTKSFQLETSYTPPIRFSTNEFATGTVGVGYYIFDNHCLTLLAHGMHTNQEFDQDADGGGVSVMGRWHFYNPGRFTFYFDGGGGYSWWNNAVPVGGTTYNFTARVGLGAGYRLFDDTYLTGGARYFHLSNGQQHGREKNPSYDGVEYYVGLLFTFR